MSVRKALFLLSTLFACSLGSAWSQVPYALLQPPQPVEDTGKIEVTEFFWYGCPHCYHLEGAINNWLKTKPADVVFRRVPAYPSDSWGDMAKLFYTIEAMGLLDQYHSKIFDAIHKDGVNLANKKIRDAWLSKNGIDPAKYAEVEKSFTVATKVARARQLTLAYKVDSVPRIFVNGKYYTAAELAGSPERIFPVVDELIAMVRKEQAAAHPAQAMATKPRK
jgi:thiol:disulfide interchange protein DsbA